MRPVIVAAIWMCLSAEAALADVDPVVEPAKTSVTAKGLVADHYVPAHANGAPLPGIIILGGSEGGMGAAAARDGKIIAQRGYAVLQLAYFDSPGLPIDLGLIPLEYFKSIEGNQAARLDSWTRAMAFIDAALKR